MNEKAILLYYLKSQAGLSQKCYCELGTVNSFYHIFHFLYYLRENGTDAVLSATSVTLRGLKFSVYFKITFVCFYNLVIFYFA